MCSGGTTYTTDAAKTVTFTEDGAAVATREARLLAKQVAAYGRPSTIFTPTGRTSMLGSAITPAITPKPTSFGGVR